MAHEILIVDDEADIRVLVSGILEDEGYITRQAKCSDTAIDAIEQRRPSLVLLDIWLQGSALDGLGILKKIRHDHPSIPVLMMSGHGTIETAVQALKNGAYDFIEKPFKTDRLLLLVTRAIEADQLKRENKELRQRNAPALNLIGGSPPIRDLISSIHKVAPTNSRVLITGPSGAGKETAARLIHAHSPRKDGPFITVNCTTLNPEQFDEDFFGTVGDKDNSGKVGTFEAAQSGTLLLDEVGDMPAICQNKIVRILQDASFQRLGSPATVDVDVRIIATTSHDLGKSLEKQNFREDLFYRLNVVPIDIPWLRDRRDDIPDLASHFMTTCAELNTKPHLQFSKDAMAVLQSYDWPGNVRELKNIIERIVIMSPNEETDKVTADALPPEIMNVPVSSEWDMDGRIMGLPLREAREVFERVYLEGQLSRFSGNISKTAEFVGMERSALHRKLKQLNAADERCTDKSENE